MWHTDPAGATEIAELSGLGFKVRRAFNTLRPGSAAAAGRLADGTLRVLQGTCLNLPEEAGLYRYGETPQDKQTENPTEAHNHALDALRYLISRLPKMRAAELREGAETPLAA